MDDGSSMHRLHRDSSQFERLARMPGSSLSTSSDVAEEPESLKRYLGVPGQRLPRCIVQSRPDAISVLSSRHNDERVEIGGCDALGTLLYLSAGITRVVLTRSGRASYFRTAMSAGNAHPIEVYVVQDHVWHYDPLNHALVPVRANTPEFRGGAVCLVLTGVPSRACWRYGMRGYRHMYWDVGTLLANLLTVASAHGWSASPMLAFPDQELAELVGVNGIDEMPLAVVAISGAKPWFDGIDLSGNHPAEPFSSNHGVHPLVVDAHKGSALRRPQVAAWRSAVAAIASRSSSSVESMPAGTWHSTVEDIILRRRSARKFSRTAPTELLGWALRAATRTVSLDVAPGGSIVDVYVNVHQAYGGEPGSYRINGQGNLELLWEGNTTRDTRRLCLDQPRAGGSAFTLFMMAKSAADLSQNGGRVYRAVQVEAGVIAGLLALAATALNCAATGLTFYDDAVGEYFDCDSLPLLAAAAGGVSMGSPQCGTPGEPRLLL